MKFHKLFASIFGIGYIKGGGSIAAGVTCLVWFLVCQNVDGWTMLGATMLISIIGVWSSNCLEAAWGKDSSKIVVDEVAGMAIGLLFVPLVIKNIIIAFILFRFFDISKVLFVRRMEVLPKGWGVMGDDILAGVYTNVIIHTLIYFNVL